MNRIYGTLILLAVLFTGATVRAQKPAVVRFTFDDYLHRVARGNIELAGQRANVSVAESQIALARVFPDPQITAGLLQYDLSNHGNPTATTVQLNVPLQIGGQRGARIDYASANLSTAQADLEDFLRTLRANAAFAYVEALHRRLILDRKRQSLASLDQLVAVNEQRFRSGEIGEVVVIQTRVEAQQFRAGVLDAEGEVRATDLTLVQFLGRDSTSLMGRPLEVEGDLRAAGNKSFEVDALVVRARGMRPDLVAARRHLAASGKQIDLVHANRIVDIGVGGGWQHSFPVSGSVPLPSADYVGATLTVPIPFSRMYRGDLDEAHASQRQADAQANALVLRVEVEVRQAVTRHAAATARVKLYTGGVLSDADQVLEKTLYNYHRGGATLVEVLVAQRTQNDVYNSYYEALSDLARALITVQQASAGWDVKL
jgi:outer membrane protein, heavy metal efflux system